MQAEDDAITLSWHVGGSHYRAAFHGPVITVGRNTDNDVVLADDSVSGHHAQLERQGHLWIVRDLGSTNGTSINGVSLERGAGVLTAGDECGMGDQVVRVVATLPERTRFSRRQIRSVAAGILAVLVVALMARANERPWKRSAAPSAGDSVTQGGPVAALGAERDEPKAAQLLAQAQHLRVLGKYGAAVAAAKTAQALAPSERTERLLARVEQERQARITDVKAAAARAVAEVDHATYAACLRQLLELFEPDDDRARATQEALNEVAILTARTSTEQQVTR